MGLIKKIFGAGAGEAKASVPPQDFAESDPTTDRTKVRNAPRRELVHTVLRDTMRKHGIPSDWIGCRVLSVTTKQQTAGVHVQFVVRKGDEQLLTYVHQFQESFWREIERLDKHVRQWLFSVAWQFDGRVAATASTSGAAMAAPAMPAAAAVAATALPALAAQARREDTQPEAGDTEPAYDDAVDLESDLAALHAAFSNPAALASDITKPR